ncbi:MAG: AMP-binding protein [Amphiplicatus sp.]|nr:AMP-binding protein [Amphiplicatus sp.]
MSFTVTNALRWWAREAPDRIALSVEDEPLTYGALLDWASHVAARLLRAGLEKGDRVAITAVNSMEYAVLEVAIVLAGGVIAPLSFRSSPQELRKSFENLSPRLFFADEERSVMVREVIGPGRADAFF